MRYIYFISTRLSIRLIYINYDTAHVLHILIFNPWCYGSTNDIADSKRLYRTCIQSIYVKEND